MVDQDVLVSEGCHKGNHPGHNDQNPRPENRCPMGQRRWYPLLALYIRNMHCIHQTPPCFERQPLCFEVEIALNGVASSELPDHAILWNVHTVLLSLGKVGWRTRNRAEDGIMDGSGSAVGIRVGGHLRFNDFSHTQCPFPALDPVLNGHEVDRHAFADQTRYVSQGAAQLSTKGIEDGFLLRGRCLVINVEYGPPVPRQYIAGNLIDLYKREVRDIHAPHPSPINVVGIDGVATTTVWIIAHPAGAWSAAGTGFQQGPIQDVGLLCICLCCHRVLLLFLSEPLTRSVAAIKRRYGTGSVPSVTSVSDTV